MNLKKVITLTFVASVFAFAQQEVPVEAQEAPATDQAVAPAEPATEAVPVEYVLPSSQPEGYSLPEHEPVPAPPAPEPEPVPVQEQAAVQPVAAEPAVAESPKPAEPAPEKQVTVATPAQPKPDSAQAPAPAAPSQAVAAQATPAQATPAQAAPQPASQPVRKGPPPKTPFTIVHGNAYNMVENEAAGDNVDLLLKNRLVKFAGQKFVYLEPAGKQGVFDLGGFFGGMDLSGDLGRATLGFATYGFAAELRLSLGQLSLKDDSGNKNGTYAGSDWGLTLSKVLGGLVITAGADWVTYADEMNVDPSEEGGTVVEERYRDIKGSLMVSDGPMARTHFWSTGVAFVRHQNEKEVNERVVNEDVDSRMTFVPMFNYGIPALRSERANLYMGLNALWPITIFDATESFNAAKNMNIKTSEYVLSMTLVPNIVSEVLLNKYVMFFGEANYEWNVVNYIWGKKPTGENYTIEETVSDKVNASIGVRLQYDNLVACEFAFGDSFFTDTKSFYDGEGVFIKFGGFVYF